MQIDLANMSTLDLSKLIRDASLELASRMSEPVIERVKAEQPIVTLREPNDDDKDFVLMIAAQVKRGIYATASERQRVAAIAEQFGPWVRRQGLITNSNAGDWKRLTSRAKAPRKREQ